MTEAICRGSHWQFEANGTEVAITITIEDSDGVPYKIELEPLHYLHALLVELALSGAVREAERARHGDTTRL